ncbi:MAG: hypothetical protein FWG10_02275 [Eubacteriaceae bacterium]|nr:hypothetical protein [Eubacteriaceae bacterium]
MRKKMLVFAGLLAMAFLAGCSALDVIGKDAPRALGDVVMRAGVSQNKELAGRWNLAFGWDAYFYWDDTSAGIAVNAGPLVAAGLDIALYQDAYLDEYGMVVFQGLPAQSVSEGFDDPLMSLNAALAAHRKRISYHMGMGHYQFSDIYGNALIWEKDMDPATPKVVFALDAAKLAASGVDIENVEGWALSDSYSHAHSKEPAAVVLTRSFELK